MEPSHSKNHEAGKSGRHWQGLPCFDPALSVLASLGCHVVALPDGDELPLDERTPGTWLAVLDEQEFLADDPVGLLGMVTLWRTLGATHCIEAIPELHSDLISRMYSDPGR